MEITKTTYNGTDDVFELELDHDMHITYDGTNFKITMLRDELEELQNLISEKPHLATG